MFGEGEGKAVGTKPAAGLGIIVQKLQRASHEGGDKAVGENVS